MLQQTEQILQATVEALQRVGLAGFSLHLHIFNHYDTSVTNQLGKEAIERDYRISPHSQSTTTGLNKSSLDTEHGCYEVSIYVENDYVDSIINAHNIVSNHVERLAEIVQE